MSTAVHPGAALLASLARWVSGADVQWLGRPVEPRPRVFFANHSSHLDALVLWGALPVTVRRVTRPVAAEDYWQQSSLRSFLATRIFRSVLIPRPTGGLFGGRRSLAPMLRELDRGCSLILFPEGTRGNGEEVAEFKGGLYQLCRSEEHTSELQSPCNLVCRLLLEKKQKTQTQEKHAKQTYTDIPIM